MEYLDVYDTNGNLIGMDSRENVHKNGLWHKTVHCWLYDQDGNVYFQIRKDRGTFYTTASGHVQAGETVEEAFVREIKEEIGITLLPENAIFVDEVLFKMDKVKEDGTTFKDRAFANVYLSEFHDSISSFRFDIEELNGLAKCSALATLELFKGNVTSIKGSIIVPENDSNKEEPKEFFASDFLVNEGENLLEKYGDVLRKIVELWKQNREKKNNME